MPGEACSNEPSEALSKAEHAGATKSNLRAIKRHFVRAKLLVVLQERNRLPLEPMNSSVLPKHIGVSDNEMIAYTRRENRSFKILYAHSKLSLQTFALRRL